MKFRIKETGEVGELLESKYTVIIPELFGQDMPVELWGVPVSRVIGELPNGTLVNLPARSIERIQGSAVNP